MTEHKKPLVLMILDGWGYREDEQREDITLLFQQMAELRGFNEE